MLLGALSIATISTVKATTTPFSKHVVFIIMENHRLSEITSSSALYMTDLASTYAKSTNYVGPVDSTWQPSLPNYIGLTSGSTQGITNENGPSQNPVSAVNIIDRFSSSGVSYKFYMENMPSNCYVSDSYPYEVHHNPIPYYTDSAATSGCASYDVPAGSNTVNCPQGAANFADINTCDGGGTSTNGLIYDLNHTASTPSFMLLTPNMCNDMHDCSVGTGNAYLSYLVPTILTSKTFEQDHTATIIITFDECSCGSSNYGTTPVYFVVAGPGAVRGHSSTNKYTHLNLLATWENNWALQCMAGDCGPLNLMTEFFIPSFSTSTNPSSISILCTVLGCSPASTVNSNLTIISVNQFSGLVNLSYIAPPNAPSGVYVTGQSSVNVPIQGTVVTITAHGSGTTSGTFVWTIKGTASVGGFSTNTTLTIHYTWCAHCVLPP